MPDEVKSELNNQPSRNVDDPEDYEDIITRGASLSTQSSRERALNITFITGELVDRHLSAFRRKVGQQVGSLPS